MDILKSLKKRVGFEHIEGDGLLSDTGMAPEDVAKMKTLAPTAEAKRRFAAFKAQFVAGDELWYYEWRREAFWGAGGYAIIRNDTLVAFITTWKSWPR